MNQAASALLQVGAAPRHSFAPFAKDGTTKMFDAANPHLPAVAQFSGDADKLGHDARDQSCDWLERRSVGPVRPGRLAAVPHGGESGAEALVHETT